MKSFILQLLLISLFVSGCARISPETRKDNAREFATKQGFRSAYVTTSDFKLQTFSRLQKQNVQTISVYIEGDGLAWRRKNKLSNDPTPVSAVALDLAAKDSAENIVYIARPCQFLRAKDLENCQPKYWSSHRYAEEVIVATSAVIDRFKEKSGASSIKLYGYSGGGVVAALLAARRDDVAQLTTMAANLDHRAWTQYHKVSPLHGSLDLNDYIESLQNVSQIHFVGGKDKIIPPHLTQTFLDKMPKQ